jgi:hypothetical protein
MKARWTLTCECCKQDIPVGSRYVLLHGRPWKTAHAIAYNAKRRSLVARGERSGND